MGDTNSYKIEVTKDGPYKVTGGVPLNQAYIEEDEDGNSIGWGEGKSYDTGDTYVLCRCGHSSKKPFCDGTHAKVGFHSHERASRKTYEESAQVFSGSCLDIMDRQELCAVGRFCDVINAWQAAISADDERPKLEKIAIEECCNCPSGRLTIKKDGAEIEKRWPAEISLVEDRYYNVKGPLFVKGGIRFIGEDGHEYEIRNRRTLCRCGNSRNMPFCDASHLRAEHMEGLDE